MERSKGQDEPNPLLHGFPAVRPRPRLCEALWKDAPPTRGEKKTSREWPRCHPEIGRSALFASLLCLQCPITCHLYSPQKMHILRFLFFSYTLFFFLVWLTDARSGKLLGHSDKPYHVKTAASTENKPKKGKASAAASLVSQMNRFVHRAVTAFYFTLKALFLQPNVIFIFYCTFWCFMYYYLFI